MQSTSYIPITMSSVLSSPQLHSIKKLVESTIVAKIETVKRVGSNGWESYPNLISVMLNNVIYKISKLATLVYEY